MVYIEPAPARHAVVRDDQARGQLGGEDTRPELVSGYLILGYHPVRTDAGDTAADDPVARDVVVRAVAGREDCAVLILVCRHDVREIVRVDAPIAAALGHDAVNVNVENLAVRHGPTVALLCVDRRSAKTLHVDRELADVVSARLIRGLNERGVVVCHRRDRAQDGYTPYFSAHRHVTVKRDATGVYHVGARREKADATAVAAQV